MGSFKQQMGLAVIGFSLSMAAQAEEWQWDIGLAVTAAESPFVDGKAAISARPLFSDRSGFQIGGPAWAFINQPRYQYFIGVSLDEWDSERGESPLVADLPTLDRAISARLGGAWKVDSGVVLADVRQAVNAHKGLQARARYTYNPDPYTAALRPYAELQYLSADVSDYYVGVDSQYARADRPTYQADAAWIAKVGLHLQHPLSERITLVGDAAINAYGKEITDSPLIERENGASGYLGLRYRW